jgi:asparagine synthase (glutamine-hydrolysing)
MDIEARRQRSGYDPTRRWFADSRRNQIYLGRYDCSEVGDILAAQGAHADVEVLDPTADLRIVEFCLGLPPSQYVREGQRRALVRRAMAGLLPPVVLLNERRGRQAPDAVFRLRQNIGLVHSMHSSLEEDATVAEYVDLRKMRTALDALATGRLTSSLEFCLLRGHALGHFVRWLSNT